MIIIINPLILQMVSAMQNIFTYLQKLAAGLEQVVVDQAKNNGPFLTEFDRAQYELKTVSYFYFLIFSFFFSKMIHLLKCRVVKP